MDLNFGTIFTMVVVTLFYLRLITLQWGKARRLRAANEAARAAMKTSKGKVSNPPSSNSMLLGVHFTNKYLVALAIVLMLLGAAMAAFPQLGAAVRDLWWIPLNLGIILFAFLIKA